MKENPPVKKKQKRKFNEGCAEIRLPDTLCIPRHIFTNPDVTSTDKFILLLLVENGALAEEGIKIRNDSLSGVLNCTPQLIGQSIRRLAEHGLLVEWADSRLRRVHVPKEVLNGGQA